MSSNPFMDYQEQFFKMWNDNMDQMLNSDAYKAMTKNIPGAEVYTKAMESMVPNVEKYWKDMASAMPTMPGMDYWTDWNKAMASNSVVEYWKNVTDKMPGMNDFWKVPDMNDYWKSLQNMMPDMTDYWKNFSNMIPGMNNYWDNFAKMMPNPEMFANMAPFKMPGVDAFTKVFDLWKTFGESNVVVRDYQKKYMDTTAEIIKSLFPENVQPFVARPFDFMNSMVEYYKQYVSPWIEIDTDILQRIAQGDADAYIDFFKEYQQKYEDELEKYFSIMGMGLNREANEDYMRYVNLWNKAMISMGELLAVIYKTGQISFEQIAERVQSDLAEGKTITTFRDFYTVWYSVTEAAYEKLLATDEFAKVFDDFSDRYAQFMIAQNKVYERMLAFLPIPTNTDMKSLYKTVYDLRKDVRDLKKEVKAAEKKGDK